MPAGLCCPAREVLPPYPNRIPDSPYCPMPPSLTDTVGHDGRPTITIRIAGGREPLLCIVDTGFNGRIWVPDHLAAGPGFESFGSEYVALADGSVIAARVTTATVDWFGRIEAVSVIVGGTGEALLGTGMLEGCRLQVDFVEGTVRIDRAASG